MKKALRKKTLYHFVNGVSVEGPNPNMFNVVDFGLTGDCTGIYGNCAGTYGNCTYVKGNCHGIYGDCSNLSGDWSDIVGDVSNVRGDCTGIEGDLRECELTEKERKAGVHLFDLVLGES